MVFVTEKTIPRAHLASEGLVSEWISVIPFNTSESTPWWWLRCWLVDQEGWEFLNSSHLLYPEKVDHLYSVPFEVWRCLSRADARFHCSPPKRSMQLIATKFTTPKLKTIDNALLTILDLFREVVVDTLHFERRASRWRIPKRRMKLSLVASLSR